jgi:xylulokinase
VGGGGARSEFWRRMLADTLRAPIATTNTEEGPAYGAALLAGVGAGVFSSVEAACSAAIRDESVVGPASSAPYGEPMAVYGRLYGDLRGRFAELGAIDR